jgi:hypothetical protein
MLEDNRTKCHIPVRPLTGTLLGSVNVLCSKSEYLEIFAALLEEVHTNFSNPLRPLMYKLLGWRADVARGAAALATHDRLMSAKLKAQLAAPPPDYTITGEGRLDLFLTGTGACQNHHMTCNWDIHGVS